MTWSRSSFQPSERRGWRDATGQTERAQLIRWDAFEERLSVRRLRAYLKALPDFEDIAAEERAVTHALGFKSFSSAPYFFVEWPDLANAAQLVLERRAEIDGNAYYLLDPAGDIVLLFAEESEALTHPYLARAWAKRGADLRVPAPGQAKKVAMMGALDHAARRLVVQTSKTSSVDFIALLERLDGLYGPRPGLPIKPVVIALDNGPIHVSKAAAV